MADLTALWHYHHADYLVEFPDETEASRREFIEAHKDREERALRLRLLKPVREELLPALKAIYAAWQAAEDKWQAAHTEWHAAYANRRAAYAKWKAADAKIQAAYAKLQTAYAEWEDAYRDNLAAIEALHKIECPDCPWNGETIFTRKDANGAWY